MTDINKMSRITGYDESLSKYGILETRLYGNIGNEAQYQRFTRLQNAKNILAYALIHGFSIKRDFIKYCFANALPLFIMIFNYGAISDYSNYDLWDLIKNQDILNQPEIYDWFVNQGFKTRIFTADIAVLKLLDISPIYKSQKIRIINDIFLSVDDDTDTQAYIRSLARYRLTDVLDDLNKRGFPIEVYVPNTNFPIINKNVDYDEKLLQYMRKIQDHNIYQRFSKDAEFEQLATYLLFRYSTEYYRIAISTMDEILVNVYSIALISNLNIAFLYAQHGYSDEVSLPKLLQNPEFYYDFTVYDRLLKLQLPTSIPIGMANILETKLALTHKLTSEYNSFIISMIRREITYNDSFDYVSGYYQDYIIRLLEQQSQLIKPVILAGIQYPSVSRFCNQKLSISTINHSSKTYYEDILQFIDDYENNNIIALYPYLDRQEQEQIKEAYTILYYKSVLPTELMNMILAYIK